MGFTLRAALAALPSNAHITVAELVPEIIDWAHGPMQDVAAGCLDDPRVHIVADDVVEVIRSRPASLTPYCSTWTMDLTVWYVRPTTSSIPNRA